MKVLEIVYNYSPVWFQNIMCSTKGELIRRRRFGKGFIRDLRSLEAGEIDPDMELERFLKAIEHMPAYREVFERVRKEGREPRIEDFPIINKLYVKEHYDEFLNKDFKGRTTMLHTGGTTGSGLVFPHSVDFENRQWATWWRCRENLGIKYGTWAAVFSSAHLVVPMKQRTAPYWRINRPMRQLICSPYHLSKETVADYLNEIEKRNIYWIAGYASNIRFLCNIAYEIGIKPMESIKFVTTGGENLVPACVEDIQRFFPKALIRTHYGQTEGVANFSMTKDGQWKIDSEMAYMELIPVSPEEPNRCRIVGTGFGNLAFPLVRYDMGDIALVEWKDGKPIIKGVEGRDNEYFVLADGTKIGPLRAYDIFKESMNVVESQIRLKAPDHIELVVVKGAKYGEKDEKVIFKEARKYFSDVIKVSISYTDKVERAKNGKFKVLVSEI